MAGVALGVARFWDTLRSSYWFIPGIMAVFAVGLAVGISYVDQHLHIPTSLHRAWWVYSGDAQGARSVLSTIAGSIVTVISVTFSITVAAFSLASQQYGPRLLRGFLRDTVNQTVLGVFVATFLYSLLILRTVRENFVPNLSVTVGAAFAVVAVGMLIYFIHHVTVSIQSDHIIESAGGELDAAICRLYPQAIGETQGAQSGDTAYPPRLEGRARSITTQRSGYVTALDGARLMRVARASDLAIEVLARPGDYVEPGGALLRAYPAERAADRDAGLLERAFTFASQRTVTQDAAFALNQLVEIAVRALSPGINNPFTAVMVLDRLTTSFSILAGREAPSALRRDDEGALRIIAPPERFGPLLHDALEPIRFYGASSSLVSAAMLRMLEAVGRHVRRDEDRRALSEERRLLSETGSQA